MAAGLEEGTPKTFAKDNNLGIGGITGNKPKTCSDKHKRIENRIVGSGK